MIDGTTNRKLILYLSLVNVTWVVLVDILNKTIRSEGRLNNNGSAITQLRVNKNDKTIIFQLACIEEVCTVKEWETSITHRSMEIDGSLGIV